MAERLQSQRIRKEVIDPLMASDFRKALDLLPALKLEETAVSSQARPFFWLFQYVPVSQLTDVAGSLLAFDNDDVRYRRALPDLVEL